MLFDRGPGLVGGGDGGFFGGFCFGQDVDAAAFLIEVDSAVFQGEDGVIAAETDVAAWAPFGAALADQDVTGDDCFAAEFLDSETLCA